MNYERLYQENPEDFKFRIYELDKKLKACLISEKKTSQEEFDELYNVRSDLERILTLNIGKMNEVLDKLSETNEGYLDSVVDEKKYKELHKLYQGIEHYITEFFDNFDKYEEFHKDFTVGYTLGAFRKLIDIFNSMPRFTHKLIPTDTSLEFLDKLSDPYLRIIQGVIEYLGRNDLIDFSSLEKKLDVADERCDVFFGYHDKYNSPIAPKVKAIAKTNGKNSNDLSLPIFFRYLSDYLRGKLHVLKPNDFKKEKIDMANEEQVSNYLNGNKTHHNPLSKE